MEELFNECQKLETLDLSSFRTDSVIIMNHMFHGCNSIKSLDLKHFYTPNLEGMISLFRECHSLESLDISNFNTSKIIDISLLFENCYSIKSINISNFDTSAVTTMTEMFYNCYGLISLDISNFNTELVYNMGNMFYNCSSLTSLNLSHFRTPNLLYMDNMFNLCKSLKYLDISNFRNEKIETMENFCSSTFSLISLNISKLNISKSYQNFFSNTNPNIILCYDENEIPDDFLLQVNSYNNNCNYFCILDNKKFIPEISICVDNCSSELVYKYEYQNECLKDCPFYFNYEQTECIKEIPQGYYINNFSNKKINKCPIKCKECSSESMFYNLCILCNENYNYYPKYNDSSNLNQFYECYNENNGEIIGYYLDNNNNIYMPCYYKCKKCIEGGNYLNNNCIECNDDYDYILDNGNCNIKQLKTTNLLNYITTDITIEPISDTMQNTHIYNNQFFSYEITTNSDENKKNYSHIYIEVPNETVKFLKKRFSLEEDDKIFVTISEMIKNDSKTATLDYIYEYSLENGTILNLSNIEEDVYVNIYVPIIDLELAKFDLNKYYSEQGYDIYNKKDEFYTDFCTLASFGNNDIILSDRKKDIYPNNITLCKSNCKYNGVNLEEQRVICECNLNYNKNVDDDEFEEDDGNFITYFLDNINYKIFVCYKLFFNINNLVKSYALYIILIIFLLLQVLNCIFIIYTIKRLKLDSKRNGVKYKKN